MSKKMTIQKIVDCLMMIVLLFLMTYELIGQGTHEWLGITMLILLVIHHLLNGRWIQSIPRGSYSPFRILQTFINLAILVTMLGSMFSALIISRDIFTFLPLSGYMEIGRMLHMLCAYWSYILLSIHLGSSLANYSFTGRSSIQKYFSCDISCDNHPGLLCGTVWGSGLLLARSARVSVLSDTICIF